MITLALRRYFFDRARVLRAVHAARVRSLSRAGAFVRKSARDLIRKRKRTSAPGQPPSSHTGLLKRLILFGYDPAADAVVIGPAATNQVFFDRDRRPVRGTVPNILEFGGAIRVLEVQRHGRYWQRADLRSRRRLAGRPTRYRTVSIAARPFMAPALVKERPRLPEVWAGSIRGG